MSTIAAILKHKGHEIADVSPSASIAEAASRLAAWGIGALLVRDSTRQPIGILSERDIVRSLAMHGAATLDMTAGQLMTEELHTVPPGTTVAEAAAIMTEQRIRHLPVMERGELTGIVSIGDVVKARIMEQDSEMDSLKAYVAGAV